MGQNDWYVPTTTMKGAEKNRKGNDNRFKGKVNAMYHCKKCGFVYNSTNLIYRKNRGGCKEEYYQRDSIPTYGLDKKDCLKCKG